MSYCTNCGAELSDEMLFCSKCGYKNIALSEASKAERTSNTTASKKKNKVLFVLLALFVAAVTVAFILLSPDKEVPFSENPEAISAAASSVVRLDSMAKAENSMPPAVVLLCLKKVQSSQITML